MVMIVWRGAGGSVLMLARFAGHGKRAQKEGCVSPRCGVHNAIGESFSGHRPQRGEVPGLG